MVKEAIFDTSAIFAAVVKNDPFHDTAYKIFQELGSVMLPVTVITELAYLFWKRGANNASILRKIVEHPKITIICDVKAPILAARTLERNGISLISYNDAVVIHTATNRQAPIVTFDKQMWKRARSLGIKVLPENI